MHATKITTNWKGAPEGATYALGALTILRGPNGSGKSAVVEALELALTGSVSNYAGRASVKDPKMLWRSCPAGAKALFAEVTLSNGNLVRWEQTRSNGKPILTLDGVVQDAPVAPTVMGIAAIRAELFGSSARAERWLSRIVGLDSDKIAGTVLQELTPVQTELFEAMRERALPWTEWADFAGKAARTAAAEAKAATAVVEELQHVVGPVVNEQDLAAADLAVQKHEALAKAYHRQQAEAAAWTDASIALQALLAERSALPDPTGVDPTTILAMTQVVQALQQTLEVWPRNSLCPCCRTDVGVLHLTTRLETLREWIAGNASALAVIQTRATLNEQIEGLQAQVASGTPPIPLYDAQAHADAGHHYDTLCRRRVASQAPGMAVSTAEGAAQRAAAYKVISKALEKTISTQVGEALKALEIGMAKYVPAHLGVPQIVLRPQVSLGLLRDGKVGAPSGGEEAILLLALGFVLANDGVLVLEDRAYDAHTLAELLKSIGQAGNDQQVFVQTTTGVTVPEGWVSLDFWPPAEPLVNGDVGDLLRNMVHAFGA